MGKTLPDLCLLYTAFMGTEPHFWLNLILTFLMDMQLWVHAGVVMLSEPTIILLLIILASLVLFILDKFPIDGVAFAVLLALLLTGLVASEDILLGFSNPATVTVAAMFILSAGLQRTGVVRWIAGHLYQLIGRSKSHAKLNLILGATTGALSAFINNTATVGVLLPVAMRLCRERGISPTKVLLSLSFAAQFGGVCTLIGTTTNLLVNAYAIEAGLPGFSLFEFTKLGLICFAVGLGYMLIASYFLPNRVDADSATGAYNLRDYMMELRILAKSPLIGQTGTHNALTEISPDIRVLDILRDKERIWAPHASALREGDIILVRGAVDRLLDAIPRLKLEDWAEGKLSDAHLQTENILLMEVLLPKESALIGKTLTQLDFYWRYHAAVLAVKRRGEVLHSRIKEIAFAPGDMLLLQGHKSDLGTLDQHPDFQVLNDLSLLRFKKKRAVYALLVMAGFVGSVSLGVFPVLTAALLAALLMVLTKCVTLEEAYKSLDWRVIILLAGLIPLGVAMQNTGAAAAFAASLLEAIGGYGPYAALTVVYLVTMLLTAVMSNNATAALLAPLAIGLAQQLNLQPEPFLVAVAFAASTCFTTPVGYQTNMMVYGPGGYKYLDFIRVGLPLNLLFCALTVILIPVFWGF